MSKKLKVEDYVQMAKSSKRNRESFSTFKADIFLHTLKWEGGGKLHKLVGDSGGYTLWGIAYNHNKKVFHNFEDFRDTTYEEAAAIAFCKYYLTAQVFIVCPDVQMMYFDMAYNLGVSRAIKIMQGCAGVTKDGLIGPMTKRASKGVTKECLYKKRKGFYVRLARNRSRLSRFLRGWMNRTEAINKI